MPGESAVREAAVARCSTMADAARYYLAAAIDVTATIDWLTAENRRRDASRRLLPIVPMMKAVALALNRVPELNGFWTRIGFCSSAAVHLGVTIATRGNGLVAPAIHDADKLTLDDLMEALRDLVARVRAGRFRRADPSPATATLASIGELGVDSVLPVIYAPQVASVGLGRIADCPRVVDGVVAVRKVVNATLAADDRATDGYCGALFLATLDRLLAAPECLR